MNEKFFDLSKEKQDRMINAALKLFALNGYRHASTDDMVKEAGISKGLLFHYFGSKQGVYSFVFEYSVRFMALELKQTINPEEKDFFTVIKQREAARLHVMRNYPYMQQFLNRAAWEDVSEALIATEEMREKLAEVNQEIMDQIDVTVLPTNVDPEKLFKLVDLTITGLMTERFHNASFQPEMMYEEIVEYLNMLKTISYEKR